MSYITKYEKIRPFVKLNIPWNKKLFTQKEKTQITKYYNKLETMGYLNREREGYIFKNIENTKYKIKNAPKLKATLVNVGTKVINGKIETDKTAQIKIINGRINVKRQGLPFKWEFEYNIKKDWKLDNFVEHLKKRMLPNKPKKGQIFVIGAGIYEMSGSGDTDIKELAKEILRISNKYTIAIANFERSEKQDPKYFMYRIVVYENAKAFKLRQMDKKKRKKKTKYQKQKGR